MWAGVKRIAVDTYGEARTALNTFLKTVLRDVSIITESARRMTVTVPDVLLALKRNGRYCVPTPICISHVRVSTG